MADEEETEAEAPKKASKLPMLIALLVAAGGGAGAFFFMYSSGNAEDVVVEEVAEPLDSALPSFTDISFVALPPMVIALGEQNANRLLRFQAQLEVDVGAEDTVAHLEPRIMDVLNTYLRAVAVEDLENRRALIRLRAQMLRRIQIVTGGEHVRDLLITEFVLT